MKILLINQTFYPDVVSTAQHLTDLARDLSRRGHEVTVIAGRHGYDDPDRVFSFRENVEGITVRRIPYTFFGKQSKWARAMDFATFYVSLAWRLMLTARHDVVVALTSPPLVAVAGCAFCALKGGRFVYWVMDLNPDEAQAAGWLKADSAAGRVLRAISRWTFKKSARIVALDRYMKERIALRYGTDPDKIAVLPPWAHDESLKPVAAPANAFRRENGLEGKFVVMYSGNHSPCHPLDTLLEAALYLKDDPSVVFCFVGGGSLVGRVKDFSRRQKLANVLQLPYVPMSALAQSLSAADLHITVMGNDFVGILHPCKLYGILAVGRPFVYIGPEGSHLGDLVRATGLGRRVSHGDRDGLVAAIQWARDLTPAERADLTERELKLKNERFGRQRLSEALMNLVENAALL